MADSAASRRAAAKAPPAGAPGDEPRDQAGEGAGDLSAGEEATGPGPDGQVPGDQVQGDQDRTGEAQVSTGPPPDGSSDPAHDGPDGDGTEGELDPDLDAMAAERDEYLDALRRLQADFENYKKRMLRQQTETLERAGEDLAVKLLPVLDTIDLARQHGAADGIDPVANALAEVLTRAGLERIDPVGQPFDPTEHEAVAHEAGDEDGEPEVVGLMRAGYRWRGRLVRAAMVTVRG